MFKPIPTLPNFDFGQLFIWIEANNFQFFIWIEANNFLEVRWVILGNVPTDSNFTRFYFWSTFDMNWVK